MKKFSLLLLSTLMALCLFTACGDDEETGTIDKAVLGTWVVKEYSSEVKTNSAAADAIISEALNSSISDILWGSYTFKEDGTVAYSNADDENEMGAFSTENKVLTLKGKSEGVSLSMSYSYLVDGDWMTLSKDVKALLTPEMLYIMGVENPESVVVEKALQKTHLVKKGSEEDVEKASIVGKWQYVKTAAGEVKTSSEAATKLITDILKEKEEDVSSDISIAEFTADGKMKLDGKLLEGVSYEVHGDKVTIVSSNENVISGTNKFTVSEDALLIFIDVTEKYENKRDFIGIAKDVIIEKVTEEEHYTRVK